jgi:ABC-type proline/glycine betaine transport system permease subunit
VGGLVVAVCAAIAIGTLVAIAVARNTRLAALLREE